MAELDITLTHTQALALILLPYTIDTMPDEPQVRYWIVSPGEDIPFDPIGFMVTLMYDEARGKSDMTRAEFVQDLVFGEPIIMLMRNDEDAKD